MCSEHNRGEENATAYAYNKRKCLWNLLNELKDLKYLQNKITNSEAPTLLPCDC